MYCFPAEIAISVAIRLDRHMGLGDRKFTWMVNDQFRPMRAEFIECALNQSGG